MLHTCRGRPPCLPVKLGCMVCRLFVIIRADNLPQPLRRRVAIGSAPTSWILISCFPSQFRFLGLMIQVLLYRAIGARRERYQHPDRSFGKQNVAVLCTPLQVQSYKKKLRSTNVSPIIFQKTFTCVSRFSVSVLERVFADLRKTYKYI